MQRISCAKAGAKITYGGACLQNLYGFRSTVIATRLARVTGARRRAPHPARGSASDELERARTGRDTTSQEHRIHSQAVSLSIVKPRSNCPAQDQVAHKRVVVSARWSEAEGGRRKMRTAAALPHERSRKLSSARARLGLWGWTDDHGVVSADDLTQESTLNEEFVDAPGFDSALGAPISP